MIERLALISILLVSILWLGTAQEPTAFQITDQDGLPSMTIYQIIEDQKGYIWLGTQKGLSRYDGQDFKEIKLSGFFDKEILSIQCDWRGRIWFNNLSGQIGFVEKDAGRVFNPGFFSDKNLPQRFILQDTSMYIAYSADQTLVKNRKKIVRVDYSREGKLKRYKELNGELASSNIRFKQVDSTIYLNNLRYDRQGGKVILNYLTPDSILLIEREWDASDPPSIVNRMELQYVMPDGFLMSDKERALCYLQRGQFRYIPGFTGSVINQYVKLDQEDWVLSKGGLYFSDDVFSDSITHLYSDLNANAIHKDKEGNLWIGTAGKGLFLVPGTGIKVYSKENGSFPKDEAYSLFKSFSGNFLYIGASNGTCVQMNLKTGRLKSFDLSIDGRVTSIVEDKNQNLWLGTDNGLYVYHLDTRQQIRVEGISACKVLTIDARQNIWVGQASSVDKIRPLDFNPKMPWSVDQPKQFILGKRTYGLLADFEGSVWIGTTTGLFVATPNGIATPFMKDEDAPFSISAICQSRDSSIWVGTASLGLLRIVDHQIVDTIGLVDGLSSNNCTSLYAEEDRLYIGTDNGLNILDLNNFSLSWVNDRDGLPSNEINSLIVDQGNIWLGTPRGVVHLPKDYQSKNESPPPIYLNTVRVNGEDLTTETATLAYWQNTLEFEFEGLAYRSRGTETYTYRLLGLEKDWNKIQNRFIRFHRLPAGHYEFQVKAINEDGVVSEQAATYFFSIATPWWKTPFFYGSLIIGLMGITGGLVYWRENERRKQEQLKNELENRILVLQSEALRTQMNPHFIYNTLNAIQDFLLTNDRNSALAYLSKFANMIRMIFDQSSCSSISLQEELEFLGLYIDLEKLRFGERVEVYFEVEDELSECAEMIELPPLLIQPIIENAFKHGLMHRLEGGILKIHFSLEKGGVYCVIEDNGVGRDKAAELAIQNNKTRKKSSISMIRERLKMVSSTDENHPASLTTTDLVDDKGVGCGMRVALFIASI